MKTDHGQQEEELQTSAALQGGSTQVLLVEVHFKLTTRYEGAWTKIAGMRFRTAVDAHVVSQMGHLGKSMRTHLALERLFTSVSPNVRSQMGGVISCVRAVRTLVNCFPRVLLMAFGSTRSCPAYAGDHLLASVRITCVLKSDASSSGISLSSGCSE